MRDGDLVRYAGSDLGADEGMVLSSSGEACHVKWSVGAKAGQITMCLTDDLQRIKSPVQEFREGSLFFDAVGEPEHEEVALPEGVEDPALPPEAEEDGLPDEALQVSAGLHLSSVATMVREHVVNLVLNDPILSQAMSEVGEETMVSMVLSEAGEE